jgi:hypothetical protein
MWVRHLCHQFVSVLSPGITDLACTCLHIMLCRSSATGSHPHVLGLALSSGLSSRPPPHLDQDITIDAPMLVLQ